MVREYLLLQISATKSSKSSYSLSIHLGQKLSILLMINLANIEIFVFSGVLA